MKTGNSSNLHKTAISDLVLSFIKIGIITEITPIKAYVDMIAAGKFGPISDLQKEKLDMTNKSIDRLLSQIANLCVAKIDEIKYNNHLDLT